MSKKPFYVPSWFLRNITLTGTATQAAVVRAPVGATVEAIKAAFPDAGATGESLYLA